MQRKAVRRDVLTAVIVCARITASSNAGCLNRRPDATTQFKRAEADLVFRRVGVTFAVYGDKDEKSNGEATERLIPFDVVPRIIPAAEWKKLEAGLRQRVRALNLFLRDVYHDQVPIARRKAPGGTILRNSQYPTQMRGVEVMGDIYAHVAGIDVVRASD